jgi:hypothetical protein
MKKIILIPILVLFCCNSWAQCPDNVTITGTYSTTYTGSNSWIASSGTTTIPTTADVTLDANPSTNGYVLLDVGFETQPNATFLAIVQTPCSLLTVNENAVVNEFTVFPNPVHDWITIKSESQILETSIFDLNGKLIFNENQNSENVILNFNDYSNGLYFLKIRTNASVKTIKILKN